MNFVRALDPRTPRETLLEPVAEELRLCRKYGFPNTMLVQYDAMLDPDFVHVFLTEADKRTEFGLWIELCRPLCEAVGIEWRGRPGYDWDWYVNPGFLMAYTTEQRAALIDELMRKFREVFGQYPQTAASWLLDAFSMDYMSRRYGIQAFGICREQFNVDAYSLWGGYYNQAYYPSRRNMLCPAQTEKLRIHTPVFRLLGPDPIYNYNEKRDGVPVGGCCTMEPAWASGQDPDVIDWYNRCYFEKESLGFAYTQLGQENSFGWETIRRGLPMQLEKLHRLAQSGRVEVLTMAETGRWFSETYKETPAPVLVADEDWGNNDLQAVWYDCQNYRAGLFVKDGRLRFRDIFKFEEAYPERYLDTPCLHWKATYDNLPVVDGELWNSKARDAGLYFPRPFSRFTVERDGQSLLLRARFQEGREAEITLSPKEICICGEDTLHFSRGCEDETTLTLAENALALPTTDGAMRFPSSAFCGKRRTAMRSRRKTAGSRSGFPRTPGHKNAAAPYTAYFLRASGVPEADFCNGRAPACRYLTRTQTFPG